MSKREHIKRVRAECPGARPSEIAEITGASIGYVYAVINGTSRYGDKRSRALKRHKPGPKPLPVKVRGRLFKSAKQCAKHFGVSEATVFWHLMRGQPDHIGVGKGKCCNRKGNPVPITIGAVTWPSRTAAAHALGYATHRGLRRAMRENPGAVMRRFAQYLARRDREAQQARALDDDRNLPTTSPTPHSHYVKHVKDKPT